MPDPHDPRGEVSAPDASDPSSDSASSTGAAGSGGSGPEQDEAAEMAWPTRDPEVAEPAEQQDREESSEPAPADDTTAGAVETTLVTDRVDTADLEPAPGEQAPSEPDESTQLISRVAPEDESPDVGNDTAEESEVRHESGDVEATDPGDSRAVVTGPASSDPNPRAARDQGPPTTRIPPVPSAPPAAHGEQPTQQFSVPDFHRPADGGSSGGGWGDPERTDPNGPRPAQAADFTVRPESPARPEATARPESPGRPGAYPPAPAGNPTPPPPPPQTPPQAEPTDAWAEFDGHPDDEESWDGDVEQSEDVGSRRRFGKRGLLVTGALAAVVVIAAGVVLAWPGLLGSTGRARAEPPPPVRLRSHITPVDGSAPAPTSAGLGAALAPVVSNPALGTFGGVVVDAATGRTLWQQEASRALVPASTAKVLTTSAALLAMDHDFRFTTKVVRGSEPGSIVLVGGGDPTLSALPKGQPSVYPDAAHLDELVAEVQRATGSPVTSVKVDVSRYVGPKLGPGWLPADVGNGYVAPIEPVMLSGGRADPTKDTSPRSQTPALDAGRELAARLGVPESSVSLGNAPTRARVLGSVRSAPLQRMVRTTMLHSDNVLAEALARQVAVATGHEPSFAGSARAVRDVLTRYGFDLSGTTIVDGSGMSTLNKITPKVLGALFGKAAAPLRQGQDGARERSTTAKLRPLLRAVPVAGGTGSLADRYQDQTSAGQGWVRAKTGTLTDVNTLAGTVVTADGRLLAFALMSNGTSSAVARPALDSVAATLRQCGCR